MRLFEVTPITPDKFNPKTTDLPSPDHTEQVGDEGSYATAYSSKTEPGTIKKVVQQSDIRNDAYYHYIQTLAKNQRYTANPYFPKIFDIHVYEDLLGTHSYVVEMERLHPLNSLSDEEVWTIGRNLFDGFDNFAHRVQPTSDAIAKLITHIMSGRFYPSKNKPGSARHRMIDNVKDPKLKQALLLIRDLYRKNRNYFIDTHTDNIMVRRGRFTPQLVLTDPIAHEGT